MFALDLYKLQIFAQVTKAGSLSKAAAALHMTQSGVSQHIKALEDSLGTILFERGRRGVALTPAGRRLHDYAIQIFRLVAEAELAVTDVSGLREGKLTIGVTPGVSAYLLPDWVQEFGRRYPNITVTAQTAITPQIIAELRSGRLDLAAIEGELDSVALNDLHVHPLQEFDQFVVIGKEHGWWQRDAIELPELAGQPIVMRQAGSQTRIWLDQALRAYAITPRVIAELDNLESIKRMVMLSTSLTILPIYALRTERELGLLRALPISGSPLRRVLRLIQRADPAPGPIARTFTQFLVAEFAEGPA